jgi:hypothetical protein
MTTIDRLEIAKKLQNHHYFFRAFWDIGEPIIENSGDLPTAAISFDSKGESVNLHINEDFWNSLNETTRNFVICHEMCHVILQHGKRFKECLGNQSEMERMNIATDVVINELLCDSFNFNRSELDERLQKNGCWFDTIFPNKSIPKNESSEFYYNLLKSEGMPASMPFSIDVHKIMTDVEIDSMQKKLSDSGLCDSIDDKFLKPFSNDLEAIRSAVGTGTWQTLTNTVVKKKKKWETVIKKWEKMHTTEKYDSVERWDRVNPRYSQIVGKTVHLPTQSNTIDEYKEQSKIDVFFFLDTSGSCINLAGRFFKAAKSLNPDKFNIRLFCFDTKVEETSLKSNKIYGGGGTSFSIIENKIQNIIKSENKKYPKAVFIITDGYGNNVSPEKPEKWYWFLSTNYTHYIPMQSKTYKLSDFE